MKSLNILLLFVSISLSLNELIPDKDNAILLNELDTKCNNGIITYKITNNQSQKYFHLIKDTSITEFELYDDDNKLSYETSTTYDFFYPITPNHILYLVVSVQNEKCISFKYYESNSINFKINEEFSYPFLASGQTIETTIKNCSNKNFFIYDKSSSPSYSLTYNLYFNGIRYSTLYLDAFYKILKENIINLKISISSMKQVVTFTYILAENSNLTDDTLICNNDFSIFRTYFIKQKPNYSKFWYSLSSDKIEYYQDKRPQTNLHGIQGHTKYGNIIDNIILMRDKGCFQIKYQDNSESITINKKESFLISTSDPYYFKYTDNSNEDMDITIYSTENNFINSIKIQGSEETLKIKKGIDKYFYNFFSTNTEGEIDLEINFNIYEKEYIIIDFEIDNYIPQDKLIINIKEEDNKKIIDIGNQGTFEIITDYNDNETDIFDNSNIEYYTFDNKIKGDDNIYDVQCRLWKSNNSMIKIFCKLAQDLIYPTKNLAFYDTEYNYRKYTFNINNYCNIPINQIIEYIPFIYSEKQIIKLDSEDIQSFKFKYDYYSNETLFLSDNKFKIVNFDDCLINSNEREIICHISNKKIKRILSFSGEKFYLGNMIIDKVQNIFDSVDDIIITSTIAKKNNYAQITKLLNEVAEFNSFIYYETNIIDINELTSNFFDINFQNFSSSCMFKKRADQNEYLLLICKTNQNETISLGKIERKILNNINIENTFIINEGNNNEIIQVNGNGGSIYSVYPEILDFTEEESLTIKIGFYGNLEGIKLNPDSLNELDCKRRNNYLECLVPKSHFENKETGYYNIYYKNHLNKYSIKYEAPLIYIINQNEQKEETDPDTEEENDITKEEENDSIKEEENDKTKEEENDSMKEEENDITKEEEEENDRTKEEEEETDSTTKEEENDNSSQSDIDSTPQETDDNNNDDNTTLIIIGVCVPIGIIIIGLSLFFILRWKKRNRVEIIDNKQYEMIPKTESMSL